MLFKKINRFDGSYFVWDDLEGFSLPGSVVSGKKMMKSESVTFTVMLQQGWDENLGFAGQNLYMIIKETT